MLALPGRIRPSGRLYPVKNILRISKYAKPGGEHNDDPEQQEKYRGDKPDDRTYSSCAKIAVR